MRLVRLFATFRAKRIWRTRFAFGTLSLRAPPVAANRRSALLLNDRITSL